MVKIKIALVLDKRTHRLLWPEHSIQMLFVRLEVTIMVWAEQEYGEVVPLPTSQRKGSTKANIVL